MSHCSALQDGGKNKQMEERGIKNQRKDVGVQTERRRRVRCSACGRMEGWMERGKKKDGDADELI